MLQDESSQNLVDSFWMAEGAADDQHAGGSENPSQDDTAQPEQRVEDGFIAAARTGNLSAFNQLVLLHQDRLYRWIVSLVKDEDLAEDLAQSTFITAYEKLCTFHSGSFRGWLFMIARNRCFDELRRQKRRPSISLDAARDDADASGAEEYTLLSVLSSDVPLPEEAAVQSERAELISRILQAIPEEFRQVLQLVDVEELDYPEVAEALRIPLGTVKSRIARARRRFRELATQYELML